MIQTETEWRLEQLEGEIQRKCQFRADGLHKPEQSYTDNFYGVKYGSDTDADRFGFPAELYSIME